MHDEVLTEKQKILLPLIKSFSKDFGLVGGTAIALQSGLCRKSQRVDNFYRWRKNDILQISF